MLNKIEVLDYIFKNNVTFYIIKQTISGIYELVVWEGDDMLGKTIFDFNIKYET